MDDMSRHASGPLADWFAAVRRLECAFVGRPRIGRSHRPADDAVRFSHPASLDFPAAAIAGVDAVESGRMRVRSTVFGLWGPNGALPLHLTEYALERRYVHRDTALEAFADVFQHRFLGLFYRAWAETQPCVQADRPGDDAFAMRLDAIVGVAANEPLSRAMRFNAARFTSRPRNADGLRAVLSARLALPVRVEECVPGWLALDEASGCRVGRSRLGHGGVLGRAVRDAGGRFRVRIGPMPRRRYLALCPEGGDWATVVSHVRRYVGDTLAWDACLCLQGQDVPAPRLGKEVCLGRSTWIGTLRHDHDPEDLVVGPANAGFHEIDTRRYA
ncbi:type VI secretion system baseplate subunit TssG [Luteibacter aegosomatis]|uniref:type VI secretion system baseplate subunit TssG n=1 Tax=Luteibacter aegosomatis TaxID=2911537 RepID=UPI001FFAA9B9|nr:type VI secretion system baseplate subunit TssG [Luteibacter aegosomatis]UPG84777.1 type VI secretion system baseplate subunit TssG [Luteibacter aegosomatis]